MSTSLSSAILDQAASRTRTVGLASDSLSRSAGWSSPGNLSIDLSNPAQRHFGAYELLELIGQGGMGAVYRARQHNLDREVALKFLAAGPFSSDEFIAQFHREAQAAARMQHPNIVEIYDLGMRDKLYFFSMRLVKGETLSERLHRVGPIDVRQTATMMRTIAETIHYAHRLHVLHLDLKPGNVLLDEHDEPLIADFGLARRIDNDPHIHHETFSGTPSYMAPEQVTGGAASIGPATDVYGLGTVLYSMLVGVPPFRGKNVDETLSSVLNDKPIAPKARRKDIPEDLDAICLKCLAKDPAHRYVSARELADDLGRFLDDQDVVARAPGVVEQLRRWARRGPGMTVMKGVALVVTSSLILAFQGLAWAISAISPDTLPYIDFSELSDPKNLFRAYLTLVGIGSGVWGAYILATLGRRFRAKSIGARDQVRRAQ